MVVIDRATQGPQFQIARVGLIRLLAEEMAQRLDQTLQCLIIQLLHRHRHGEGEHVTISSIKDKLLRSLPINKGVK